MITNLRRAPVLALTDVLLPLQRAWWALLGVPMLAVLHWLVTFLGAYPVALAVGPFGLAVIVMTLMVRLVLLPLVVFQVRATIRARRDAAALEARLAPQIEELRRRHRRRPDRLAREIAELRRRSGARPLAGLGTGLLTTIAQTPLLIAFYWVILAFAHGTGQPLHFLWMANIALPDPILLPVLAGLTTLVGARLAARVEPPSADPAGAGLQRLTTLLSPIGLAIAAHLAPAALVLYWVTGGLVGLVQQWAINRILRSALPATSGS
jgi:YidC/Oxa1 family membrane protein insertase